MTRSLQSCPRRPRAALPGRLDVGDQRPGTRQVLGNGQAVLCSSLADQVSWESKTYQNSVFTRRLIEGLESKGNKTNLADAYDYLKDAVESEVLRDRGELQTPVLNTKLWLGSGAILAVKPAKPRPNLK